MVSTYPASSPPAFAIEAAWLAPHRSSVVAQLVQQYDDGGGAVCVFTWINWLQNDLLSFIGRSWTVDPAVVKELVAADGAASGKEFDDALHMCDCCLETKHGRDFQRLECAHAFCTPCVSGKVLTLRCLDISCPGTIFPHHAKRLLLAAGRDAAVALFEKLSLEKGLEAIGAVAYCPRCSKPVLLEGEGSPTAPREVITGRMGMCPYCSNAWCVECGKSWHGLSSCQNIMAMWREGNKEVREALEKRFGAALFARLESEEWISKHTKKCPKCRSAIEKNNGCNHMTCVSCRHEFCWMCFATYTPMHFATSRCQQYDDDYFEELGIPRAQYYGLFQ